MQLYNINIVMCTMLENNINPRGGGTPHMKGVGMLIGNFELNPQRRLIWAWPNPFLTPKRDHVKTQTIYIFIFFRVQP